MKTASEWREYIMGLTEPEALISKSNAANSIEFVRSIMEDGLTADDVEDVLRAFAEQLQALGLPVGPGGDGAYMDLRDLLPQD